MNYSIGEKRWTTGFHSDSFRMHWWRGAN